MTRSVGWFALLAVGAAALTASCASIPTDEYLQAMQPLTECQIGSRICRKINPRTGRADTPFPVTTIYVNGAADMRDVLRQVPYLY